MAAHTSVFNVAVVPPESICGEVASLSRQATALGGLFEVDNSARRPHLTLYMSRMSYNQLGTLLKRVKEVISRHRPIHLRHTGYLLTSSNYYEVSYANNSALMSLHNGLVEALHDLRYSPTRPIREEFFGDYSLEQRNNVRLWGYDLVGSLYRPHVTITKFSEPPNRPLPEGRHRLSFRASVVGVFTADQNGSARHLVGESQLGEVSR